MKTEPILCDCTVIHGEIVERVRDRMPNEEALYVLSDFFKVLGDSTRVNILCALDENELCGCDLAVLLNMTKSAISHQLKALKLAKLVKARRMGKMVLYSLADDHVKMIFEMGLAHIEEDRKQQVKR